MAHIAPMPPPSAEPAANDVTGPALDRQLLADAKKLCSEAGGAAAEGANGLEAVVLRARLRRLFFDALRRRPTAPVEHTQREFM